MREETNTDRRSLGSVRGCCVSLDVVFPLLGVRHAWLHV